MPTNKETRAKRAWGIPRKRLPLDVPVPFAIAFERYKRWAKENHGTEVTNIDFFMCAALQQSDQLRKFHDEELKTYKGVKYGTNIDCVKKTRRRSSSL